MKFPKEYSRALRSLLEAEHDYMAGGYNAASEKARASFGKKLDKFFTCFSGRVFLDGVVEVYDWGKKWDKKTWTNEATSASLDVQMPLACG